MITVTFCIRLKTNCLCDFFGRIINSLNFTPSKMDVFYNEFSTPQFFIKYNPQLPDLLSLAEVDGRITSFSLYDNKYSNENVTPFFRAKILDTTFSNEQVACILEWVSYPTLYFNPDTNFLSKYLCDEVKINTWREDKFERSVANGTETVFVTLRFCVVRKQLKATLKPNAAGVQLPPHYYRNG